MGHILSIQDLSCVGRCSLTVALPVLSAMGHRCSVLPTAVLSTHTGFPQPEVVSLTEAMLPFARHWRSQGIVFDAISVGYLSCPEQAQAVLEIADSFPCPLILDPAMGDGGRLYSRITPAHIEAMKSLCARADVVLPNVTEAAFLTGTPYAERPSAQALSRLAEKLLALGVKEAVITGIRNAETIGWYFSDGKNDCLWQGPRIPGSFHGTGDLFAAVFAGAYLKGRPVPEAAEQAAEFVRRCVSAVQTPSPSGVPFEGELPGLMSAE